MKFSITRTTIAAIALVVVALAGCSSSSKSTNSSSGAATSPSVSSSSPAAASSSAPSLSGKITVFAASSLTGTFTSLGKQFEAANPGTTITFSFGSSGTLATQIDQGAPADVFASASPKNMKTVIAAKFASSSTTFVKNIAEIAAAPGNPAHITSLADLAKSGVKVALCVSTAPCGALAQTVLKNAGVTVKPTASEPDVKSTLAIVETKEVDAGIVYVTDVKAAGSKVVGVAIPAAQNATTEYPIAALTHSANPTLAAAFVAFIESPAARSLLMAAGFESP
jgi:molybdate transport system substrate-binding protein